MSKPESETDPWAKVRTFDVSTYGDCRMERDYYGEIASEQKYQRGEYAWVDEVDAARAAEATQHAQEIAAKDEHIAVVEGVLREHSEFGGLFQPGGRFHRVANLRLGGSAVADGGRWLVARLAAVEAERDQKTAEVETLRGVGCNEDGDGPCGACLKCARAERDRLKAALSTAAFALDLAGFRRDRDAAREDIERHNHEPPTLQRHDHSTGGR